MKIVWARGTKLKWHLVSPQRPNIAACHNRLVVVADNHREAPPEGAAVCTNCLLLRLPHMEKRAAYGENAEGVK